MTSIPAPGHRGYTSGAPVYAGYRAYCGSSAVSGILGLDLYFSSQGLATVNGDYRTLGLPLRCLSE